MKRILAALALCLLMTGAAPAGAKPLIGLSLNVPEGGGAPELIAAVQEAKAAGVTMLYLSYKWSDLEPSAGKLDTSKIREDVRGLAWGRFQALLTLRIVDTNNRTLPADLMSEPFGSPRMRARLEKLLRQVNKELTPAVRWINLGNEVDIYFGERPAELEPYAKLTEHGRLLLRRLRPGLSVGVTTTFDGLRDRPHMIRRLNRSMDIVTMTYYPLRPDFGVRPVSDVAGDFKKMARAAGRKPLLMQEVGYPADTLLGSSDTQQAAFVDAVFEATARHSDRIAVMNYFLMYDFGKDYLDIFVKYYRVPDPRFRAFLATLGLKRADGSARPAWERFQSRAKSWAAVK